MAQRFFWAIPLTVGLAGGGLALWWMFGSDDPARTTGGDQRNVQMAADEPLEPFVKPAPPPRDYAGSQSCRECHSQIWESYQTHPMSHSLFPASEAIPPEDFEHRTSFTAGAREYRVERTEQGVRHHEIAKDAAGETIYDQAVEVHYAVGSGKRGRSYFIDRGGLLFMSPISWYSEQGEGKWDLSPNYSPGEHLRFDRRIVDACVACHVGVANPRPEGPDRFESPPFAELSIGCERCHGPGQRHIERQRPGAATSAGDGIVNPARLDAPRRDAVCFQCHLLGQERILQYGRTEFDFRPGMHLGDVWAVLVEGTGVADDDSTEAVSQSEQMLASRCYAASDGRLGCISCHDPHRSPSAASRLAFYRERCLGCHSEKSCSETAEVRQAAEGDSCIACHMPRLSANDVPHTSQTDHRVLKRKAVHKTAARSEIDPEGIRIFGAGTDGLSGAAERRARGILLSMLADRQHDVALAARVERSLAPLVHAAPDDAALLDALGVVATLQRRPADAFARWQAMLTISPTNESALQSLATQSTATGQRPDAVMFLERALAVNPWNPRLHEQRSRLLARLGRNGEAIIAAQKAIDLDPSRIENYEWLAGLCSRSGRVDESKRYEELRRRLAQSQAGK